MATGDRVKRLLTNVRAILGDEGDLDLKASPKAILDALNRVQRRIAEEAMCLEDSMEITISSSSETYDFPESMIHERQLIPSNSTELTKIDFSEVDRLKRSTYASDQITDSTAGDVYYYYKWNGKFGFLLSDGSAPNGDSTVTIYYWRYPYTSEDMTETRDPILDSIWDSCLFYGAVFELSGSPQYEVRFEREIARRSEKEKSVRSDTARIPNNQDYD